jgi:DNA invertase Pin-like site-specific DNA recombinase
VIGELVVAGMEHARRHGTKSGNAIGRPKRVFDRSEVIRLRQSGLSIEKIACQMRIGVGTVARSSRPTAEIRSAFQKALA